MIDPDTRQSYDYNNIEKLYTEYVADKIDDYEAINGLKRIIEGKEVFLMVPGNTLNTQRNAVDKYIEGHRPVVISVNFVADVPKAYAFFGNPKRYSRLGKWREGRDVIISSNVKSDSGNDIVVNYHSLINRGYRYFENSTIMLLNLLKRVNPSKITIAGFDGFDSKSEKNYVDNSYQNERHVEEFEILNKEISIMFGEIVETMYPACQFEMITPSLYENVLKKITARR
jgi:4-hydroxy 2-oxovalerate aldolase